MEDSKELLIIDKLAGVIQSSSQNIVSEYTQWFIASSVSWIFVGFICFFAAFKVNKKIFDLKQGDDKVPYYIALAAFCALGMLFIACNIPDLFAPKAAAIHQLIQDIKS